MERTPFFKFETPEYRISYVAVDSGYVGTVRHLFQDVVLPKYHVLRVSQSERGTHIHAYPAHINRLLAGTDRMGGREAREAYGLFMQNFCSAVALAIKEDTALPSDLEAEMGLPSWIKFRKKKKKIDEKVSILPVPSHIVDFAKHMKLGIKLDVRGYLESKLPPYVKVTRGESSSFSETQALVLGIPQHIRSLMAAEGLTLEKAQHATVAA